jgi:hypothetical protein
MLVPDVFGKRVVDVRADVVSVPILYIGIEFHFCSQGQVSKLKRDCFLLLSKILSPLRSVLPMVIIGMVGKFNINLVDFFKELIRSKIIRTANLKVLIRIILDNR